MLVKLDKKDWKILEALCTNARQSHNQIARQVGLSKNAITYRIDRLFKKGVLGKFSTIVNSGSLGLDFYEIFLKLHGAPENEAEVVDYLTKHPHVLVVDRLMGSWDLMIEMGCYTPRTFFELIEQLKKRFCGKITRYEAHPIIEAYKVEQLPIELLKPKEAKPFHKEEHIDVDEIDLKLMHLLDQDTTMLLHVLAEKVGLTAETVSARLKKLREKHVILRHTAQVNLSKLGYSVYLVQLDLQNVSAEKNSQLRSCLLMHNNIRYAFMSSTQQSVFVVFAAETTKVLEQFLSELKESFYDIIVDTQYSLFRRQYKYSLFPSGFVK